MITVTTEGLEEAAARLNALARFPFESAAARIAPLIAEQMRRRIRSERRVPANLIDGIVARASGADVIVDLPAASATPRALTLTAADEHELVAAINAMLAAHAGATGKS